MLSSIDSCHNRVSADQYHLTVSRAQVSTNQGRVFFEVIRWQFNRFQMIAGSRLLFLKFISNMLCLCQYRPALLRFWFQTDLRSKNTASFFKIQARETFSYHGHVLVTLHVQFLCSDWLKFDGWVHAIYAASWKLFTLTAEADRVLSQLVMFLTAFFHWMYKMKYISRGFSYSWLVCLLGFWLRNASLVKADNPISDGIVFVFHLAGCVRELWRLKRSLPYLIAFRSCISKYGKPE